MLDYRNNPYESPVVWCLYHLRLIPSEKCVRLMTTVFQVTAYGVFPCGLCSDNSCATVTDAEHRSTP